MVGGPGWRSGTEQLTHWNRRPQAGHGVSSLDSLRSCLALTWPSTRRSGRMMRRLRRSRRRGRTTGVCGQLANALDCELSGQGLRPGRDRVNTYPSWVLPSRHSCRLVGARLTFVSTSTHTKAEMEHFVTGQYKTKCKFSRKILFLLATNITKTNNERSEGT